MLFSGPQFRASGAIGEDVNAHYFASPPLPFKPKLARLRMRWKDQGWGNQ